MSATWIYSDCLYRSCFSVLLGTVCISGCRFLVHSGAPLRCLESWGYYLRNIQNILLHADVTSISFLTYLKKLYKTTKYLKANIVVTLHASSSLFITIQHFPVMCAIVPRRMILCSGFPTEFCCSSLRKKLQISQVHLSAT